MAVKALEQTAAATNAVVGRLHQELPAACRQAARDEMQPMRQQLTGQRTDLETLTSHVANSTGVTASLGGTVRGLCYVLVGVGIAFVASRLC